MTTHDEVARAVAEGRTTWQAEADRAVAEAFGRTVTEPDPVVTGEYRNAFGRVVTEVAPTPVESVTEEAARLVRELEHLAVSRLGMSATAARVYAEQAGSHVHKHPEGPARDTELRMLRARTVTLRESLPLGGQR